MAMVLFGRFALVTPLKWSIELKLGFTLLWTVFVHCWLLPCMLEGVMERKKNGLFFDAAYGTCQSIAIASCLSKLHFTSLTDTASTRVRARRRGTASAHLSRRRRDRNFTVGV